MAPIFGWLVNCVVLTTVEDVTNKPCLCAFRAYLDEGPDAFRVHPLNLCNILHETQPVGPRVHGLRQGQWGRNLRGHWTGCHRGRGDVDCREMCSKRFAGWGDDPSMKRVTHWRQADVITTLP